MKEQDSKTLVGGLYSRLRQKRIVWHGLVGIAIMAGLYLSSQYSYLLFHSTVEIFSVIVAVGIFVVAWHTRKPAGSSYLLLLGFAYLSVSVMDFMHTLSYKGMGVFPDTTANLSTQLWIQARYVEAFSLLFAPLLVGRKINNSVLLLGYVFITLCLLVITFATDLFPVCYVEGEGLTLFKKGSEYAVCVLLLFAAVLHYLKREDLETGFLRLILGSIALTVMAELAFTRYLSVYGPANLVGHFLKVASFVLIYRAIVVTGLLKPQDALAESERILRAFIDSTQDALCIRDRDRKLVLWNRAFADSIMTNCGVEVSVGMRVEDYVSEDVLAKFKSQREKLRCAFEGEPQQANFEFPCQDSQIRYLTTTWSPVREGQEIIAVAETTSDVTEKKAAEERYQSVVENAHEAIVVTQGETVKYCNPKTLDMTGYSKEEIYSTPFIELIHPEDRSEVQKEFQERLSGEETSATYTIRTITKSGEVKWLIVNSAQIMWEGKPALLTMLTDITELKTVQTQLIETEKKYRTVADFTYDWVYWEYPDGTFKYMSPSCERITGYTEDEFLNKPKLLSDIITPEDKYMWDRHRDRSSRVGGLGGVQFRIRRKDGTIRWIEHVCQPIKDDKGAFLGYRASNRDITERRLAQQESQQLRSELIHASRVAAMGELTAAIAHEISQPLTAILTNAQAGQRFLKKEEPDLGEVCDILADIIADDNRAKEIIRRLRSLLRKSEHTFERININEIIRDVVPLLHSGSVIENVSVETQLEKDPPIILGDKIQLQQVLVNLMLNGFEAMRDMDSRELHISTDRSNPEFVTVNIRDSGSGLNEKRTDDLFQPFFTTKASGMGMGLAICRSIIESHGGRIWAKNNSTKGATFYFTIPVFKGA